MSLAQESNAVKTWRGNAHKGMRLELRGLSIVMFYSEQQLINQWMRECQAVNPQQVEGYEWDLSSFPWSLIYFCPMLRCVPHWAIHPLPCSSWLKTAGLSCMHWQVISGKLFLQRRIKYTGQAMLGICLCRALPIYHCQGLLQFPLSGSALEFLYVTI